MKIIVTGGCGFIGSHIVDKLCDLGYTVQVIDDLSASENEKFYFNKKATYHKISICDKEMIEPIFENCDFVFHLAAESRIQPAIQNPIRAYQVNVMGTLNIAELSKKYGVKRVIYSSTSSVYGLTNNLPTFENQNYDCLNPYSHSKLLGEEILRYYTKVNNLDSIIFRYFNVFGERSPIKGQYAPVVGIFLNQEKNKLPLTVVGDGLRKRDFVHVYDIVDANIAAMNHKQNLLSETINVGRGRNISIIDLAKMISNNIVYIPDRIGEAENTLADISKLKSVLNFEPKIDIKKWIDDQL
jgi:UDP-glucose 4-epimerase